MEHSTTHKLVHICMFIFQLAAVFCEVITVRLAALSWKRNYSYF